MKVSSGRSASSASSSLSLQESRMFSQMVLQRWCFTLFLLCSPVPHHGRPVDGLSGRT